MSDSTVTVLAGFSPAATAAVARSLLVTDPDMTARGATSCRPCRRPSSRRRSRRPGRPGYASTR